MRPAKLFYIIILVFILLCLVIGGYFVFVKRENLLFKYLPNVYWKKSRNLEGEEAISQEEGAIIPPQVSGRVIKRDNSRRILVIELVGGENLELLVPQDVYISRLDYPENNIKMLESERIDFENITEEDYILVVFSSEKFYEDERIVNKVSVSRMPVFIKIEKYD